MPRRPRSTWLALGALLTWTGFGLGGTCDGSDLKIVAPARDATVTTLNVPIEIVLDPSSIDPASLVATLNGAPLALSGGPGTWTASLAPGAPLADDCLLEVRARAFNGIGLHYTSPFHYLPPGKAHARRISDPADLITGPLAHNQLGDFMLDNGVARFVIQDAPQRDLYSVGQFGGNLIDAELVGHPGLDNFLELQPAANAETVINAQTIEIVNDGQDGTPAVVRSCGPDDLLDFVNPSTIITERGFTIPAAADDADHPVEGCTEWILEPGKARLKLRTTMFNLDSTDLGQLVGDYISASGELDQWTPPFGMGEVLFNVELQGLYFEGIGEATGVSYAVVPVPVPGSAFPVSSFLSTSGVTFQLQSHNLLLAVLLGQPPTFVIPAGGSKSFDRYFGIGDGSAANGIDLDLEVDAVVAGTIQGCVTVGGAAAAGVRVAVGPVQGGQIQNLTTHFVTNATGCYSGKIAPGSYGVAAARNGSLYQGSLGTPTAHMVTINANAITAAPLIDLPAPARVRVTITDAAGSPTPGRVSIVGFDPNPEPTFVVPGGFGLPDIVTATFHDVAKDPIPFGFLRSAYAGADGIADFEADPGSYQLYVSRGGEWSLYEQAVTLTSGVTLNVAARIAQVVETPGFISSDYHVHGIRSTDSRINDTDRVLQFAGEGVDNLIMTDHHVHTDLTGRIAQMGMTPFLRATVGEEITSWDYGHFNAYPLKVVPGLASRGSTDWAGAAPVGQDFPSAGAYSLTPKQIFDLAATGPTSFPDTAVQVNHVGSHFGPLRIDTSLVPPQSFITPAAKLTYRLDPASGNLFHNYHALELWNGSGRGHQSSFLNGRMGIWFNLLNQGLITTFIADTDTHEFFSLGSAGARTWTASSTDAPAAIDPNEVGRAVKAGRATGGQGIYVQTRLVAGAAAADLTLGGSTLVAAPGGAVQLEIDVQAPVWAEYDRIEIYANAQTTVTGRNQGTPVDFSAIPTQTLDLGPGFARTLVDVAPQVPGAKRYETQVTVPFQLTRDTWFVVVVKGRDGVSKPMFPIFPQDLQGTSNTTLANLIDGNLNERGTLALGATNALYADVDGVPGYQPPNVP